MKRSRRRAERVETPVGLDSIVCLAEPAEKGGDVRRSPLRLVPIQRGLRLGITRRRPFSKHLQHGS